MYLPEIEDEKFLTTNIIPGHYIDGSWFNFIWGLCPFTWALMKVMHDENKEQVPKNPHTSLSYNRQYTKNITDTNMGPKYRNRTYHCWAHV